MTSAPHPGIDATFVPRLRTSVVGMAVGDEAVLYEEDTGGLHRLDPIAAIVCSLFDGRTSVATASAELAAAFDTPIDVIEHDVLGMVRQLGDQGLLAGIDGIERGVGSNDDGC